MAVEMSPTYLLYPSCGVFLLAAVTTLWRRELSALLRAVTVQGAALALIAASVAAAKGSAELAVVAVAVAGLEAGLLPWLLRRALALHADPTELREVRPVVNVTASLVVAAGLALVAHIAARPLVALDDTPATRAAPVALTAVLLGLFMLATRRRAVSQVVGLLLIKNGITAVAFLTAAGLPLLVELGVSLDLLLAVVVLQILTARLHRVLGGADLDELRELHD